MCRGPLPKMQSRQPKHPPEMVLHDQANLIALPVLTLGSLAGLLGLIDTYWVTVVFMVYILVDLVWLWLRPTAVPSLANIILAHHVVTLLLLTFPLRHKQFGTFTCWDGLTELNTWFMIVRRTWGRHRELMNNLYWLTFIPQRLIMYPALLVLFWYVTAGHTLADRLLVCTCQFLLCCFNVGVFSLSMQRRHAQRKKQEKVEAEQSAKGSGLINGEALKSNRNRNFNIRADTSSAS